MPETDPFHSSDKTDNPVYHNYISCTEGNNIEKKNRTEGEGKGRKLCDNCYSIAKEELKEKLALRVKS